jgi:hypothetical protein
MNKLKNTDGCPPYIVVKNNEKDKITGFPNSVLSQLILSLPNIEYWSKESLIIFYKEIATFIAEYSEDAKEFCDTKKAGYTKQANFILDFSKKIDEIFEDMDAEAVLQSLFNQILSSEGLSMQRGKYI